MSAQPVLNVAVVGVGALGRHHARILSKMADVKLVGVADPNPQQGRQVAADCQCEWLPDFRSLFSAGLDAVSLVVPTSLHRAIAEEFLCRNIPVLVEKPLTANVADGALLVRVAQEHRIPLQVGHIERFNPAFTTLQQKIGVPKYIRCERLSPYAFRSMDIGAIHDLMIHDIELTLALVKEMPHRVEAFGTTLVGGLEDCVQARLHFPSGCVADLTANRVAPQFSRTLHCWSEKGAALADLHARTVTTFSPSDAMLRGDLPFELVEQGRCTASELKPEIFSRFIRQEKFQATDEDALTAELTSFLECVRTGSEPLVSGTQALNALRVAERIGSGVADHEWDGHSAGRRGPYALLEHYLGARPVGIKPARAA